MKEELISTIITTYKRSESLVRAIESVLNQTYKNIEIIVVDDNNPDSIYREKTASVMNNYSNNPKIKYIRHTKNMNGAHARNTGLKVAHGEYITFLDDDDEYTPDRFKKMIPLLENTTHEVGAIFSAFCQYRNNKLYRMRKLNFSDDIILDLLSDNFTIGSGSNFILKKSVIDKVGGFDGKFLRHQDFEFLVRVAQNFKFIVLNESLLKLHTENIHNNHLSIDKLIETKQQYLNKYQLLVDERDEQKIINSQLESLIFLMFTQNQQNDYHYIIDYYKQQNPLFYGRLNLIKMKLYSKLRNYLKTSF